MPSTSPGSSAITGLPPSPPHPPHSALFIPSCSPPAPPYTVLQSPLHVPGLRARLRRPHHRRGHRRGFGQDAGVGVREEISVEVGSDFHTFSYAHVCSGFRDSGGVSDPATYVCITFNHQQTTLHWPPRPFSQPSLVPACSACPPPSPRCKNSHSGPLPGPTFPPHSLSTRGTAQHSTRTSAGVEFTHTGP